MPEQNQPSLACIAQNVAHDRSDVSCDLLEITDRFRGIRGRRRFAPSARVHQENVQPHSRQVICE